MASLLLCMERAKPVVATTGLHIFGEGGAPCRAIPMIDDTSLCVPGNQLWPHHPPPRNHQLFNRSLGLSCFLGHARDRKTTVGQLVEVKSCANAHIETQAKTWASCAFCSNHITEVYFHNFGFFHMCGMKYLGEDGKFQCDHLDIVLNSAAR